MQAQMVVFYAPKLGNEEREWEDGAAGDCGNPDTGRNARFAVADGATGGFASARWAEQLVAAFVGSDRADGEAEKPALTRDTLRRWLQLMQARWHADPRTADGGDLARLKAARVGSFATLLGCELSGLDGSEPQWHAVALGDAMLIHVQKQKVTPFPRIAAEEFGSNPDGVSTRPEGLPAMVDRLSFESGDLAAGDRLYLTTDAFAKWIVDTDHRSRRSLWTMLARLDHPATFRKLVADQRRAGAMPNDDVTLMRVHIVATEPAYLVVCL